MARRKKPEGETTEQTKTRRLLESIADNATRGEKVAWDEQYGYFASKVETN
jgi:hypothetical protein